LSKSRMAANPLEQRKTWEQFGEELKTVNRVLNSLDNAEPTDAVNKKLLQQVKILARMVGVLNAKLRLP
jgi:ribosome biogenesis GTPase A